MKKIRIKWPAFFKAFGILSGSLLSVVLISGAILWGSTVNPLATVITVAVSLFCFMFYIIYQDIS